MPTEVISAVPGAIVCAPETLCARIAEVACTSAAFKKSDRQMINEICRVMLSKSGCDFRVYHPNMVMRRVSHCMHVANCRSLTEYARRLGNDDELVRQPAGDGKGANET